MAFFWRGSVVKKWVWVCVRATLSAQQPGWPVKDFSWARLHFYPKATTCPLPSRLSPCSQAEPTGSPWSSPCLPSSRSLDISHSGHLLGSRRATLVFVLRAFELALVLPGNLSFQILGSFLPCTCHHLPWWFQASGSPHGVTWVIQMLGTGHSWIVF